ncbi:predicted protein [Naegleria gruberi]|uniref:Predicted protein n=1 Tax=Naegleria gruberi TaxID=5762 RepID=D2VTJ9_NAEGR|nr:uncharacterized protein NAEGRDRAFT_72329 [Naegleria gruberi]EFC39945.1 predicted protein [Naegleria gruberi]|eukprot:XP_002672689.1 predicted protein [Naegleria gruberi strain NEG-M]
MEIDQLVSSNSQVQSSSSLNDLKMEFYSLETKLDFTKIIQKINNSTKVQQNVITKYKNDSYFRVNKNSEKFMDEMEAQKKTQIVYLNELKQRVKMISDLEIFYNLRKILRRISVSFKVF